jgi:general nucleoside transport system permease protein
LLLKSKAVIATPGAAIVVLDGLLISALRSASPLLFVVMGETLTQRVGVINLGVEGQMLVGAMTSFAVTVVTGNPWLGLLVGGLAGLALSTLHLFLCLICHSSQIASGIAVWILGSGLSAFFGREFVGQQLNHGFNAVSAPRLASVPVLGPLITEMTPVIGLSIALSPLLGLWLYRSRAGLAWRAVGESIPAARAMGINPFLIQCQGILAGGFLSGIGGASLSIDYTLTWAEGMTVGRGLVAVGLVIIARWNPYLALPVALLFGGSEALALRLQAVGAPISPYLLSTLPYLLSILVLMLSHRQSGKSSGMPEGLRSVFYNTT